MKKIFILLLFLLTSNLLFSQMQQMQIKGQPEEIKNEIIGKRDANGEYCAAIKVVSNLKDLRYESYNGVVKVETNPGQDIVYLSASERVLTVYHSGHDPKKIILSEHDIDLKPKSMWKIKLLGNTKGDKIPINIITKPKDVNVFLDGNKIDSIESIPVTKGKHSLLINKKGYKKIETNIKVSISNTLFKYTLDQVELQSVTIKSQPTGATIYIDNSKKGTTNKGIWLYPGEYQLQLQKSNYLDLSKTIQVTQGKNQFTYDLTKNAGNLSLDIQPNSSKILINKQDYSGQKTIELTPGQYKLEIKKKGYYPASQMITIKREQTLEKNIKLKKKTGKLLFNVKPIDSKVQLKQDGELVKEWTGMKSLPGLMVGKYKLICEAAGYKTTKKDIKIKENKTNNVNFKLEKGPTVSEDMVYVEGGTFQMGSNSNEAEDDEQPVHTVRVDDFYISKYEVTQKRYKEVMGYNPSEFDGENNPVDNVSWYDAVKFCNKLSRQEGLTPCYTIDGENVTCDFSANGYRLPTEAEWEYAAKGGQQSKGYKYAGSDNIDEVAWYRDNSGDRTHPVGQKQPNELGIYDMSGNVWEWCWDWYSDSYYSNSLKDNPTGPSSGGRRVERGGVCSDYAGNCRTAFRYFSNPSGSYFSGFRILRTE